MNTKRTNIILNMDLVRQAKDLTGLETTKDVVHAALEALVLLRRQEQVRTLRGALRWEGDLDALRAERTHAAG